MRHIAVKLIGHLFTGTFKGQSQVTSIDFPQYLLNCPVIKAETPELRGGRLALCALTARTLEIGLGLLGIACVERM